VVNSAKEKNINKMPSKKYQHLDSVDVSSSGLRVVLSVSSLEGNKWDGGLRLVSKDGVEMFSCDSPSGISMVRFSGPRLLLAARDDGNVVMYSSDKLEEMQVFEAHDDIVSCINDDSHNESQFASCGWDGSIYIWDWRLHTSKHAPLLTYSNSHNGYVNDVKYSPFEGNTFTSVGRDGFVRVWDKRVASSGCASIINVEQTCSCMSYDHLDQNILLVGTDAGDISIVDLRGSGPSPILSVNRLHKGRVRRITLSPSDCPGMFASASDDTTVAISCRETICMKEAAR
jgi:WD40 repeat protein